MDSINLRGFDAKRFVTALDGLTVQKTGGRKSSNIVDYSLLPAFLIDSVEILPGPHSALYDSKSSGGVLNFTSAKPQRYDSLAPRGRLTTSYSSYNTQVHNLMLRDVWVFSETENPAYNVFDFGVQQLLFKRESFPRKANFKVYAKNIFDEEYSNASGYPATDRTFGVALNLEI